MFHQVYHSPLGDIFVHGFVDGLAALTLGRPVDGSEERVLAIFDDACEQLQQYFWEKKDIAAVPLVLGGTAKQLLIWRWLVANVRFGETVSYQQIAAAVNSGARAVGNALAANPVPLLIPCHRVVLASGKVGNYSLGGPQVKRYLLDLEIGGGRS